MKKLERSLYFISINFGVCANLLENILMVKQRNNKISIQRKIAENLSGNFMRLQ